MAPHLGLRGSSLSRAMIWLVVCPAFFCYGYNLSVAGGLLTLDSFIEAFPQLDTIHTVGDERRHNSTMQGTVVALFTVGGMFGSLSCVYLGDKLGRKRVVLVASAVTAAGAALMASSFGLAQLMAARVVLGVGTGGYLATVPVWQSEMSGPARRGAHVVTDGIFLGAGASAALWIDLGFYFAGTSSACWRVPLGAQTVPLLAMAVFSCVLPESPRWLVRQGRQDEARRILAALGGAAPDDDAVARDVGDIELSLALSGGASWTAMLGGGPQRLRHRTLLAAAGQMFQQLCGINLVSMYATAIFQQGLHMGAVPSRVLAAAMCLTQPLGGGLAFLTIDRLGRRVLMLSSAAAMAVCMAVLSGTTSASAGGGAGARVASVVSLFAFQFIFTVGYAGLTFLYAAEVAPLQLRAAISAVSTAAVWVFNFLLAELTPVALGTIGSRYYIVFAVLNAAIVPTVYFFFPETGGRSLEEIDQIFLQSKSIWDPPKIARSLPLGLMRHPGGGGESSEESASSCDAKGGCGA